MIQQCARYHQSLESLLQYTLYSNVTAGAHLMSFFISSPIFFATGFRENFSSGPSLGRPRWEHASTLAPLLQRYSIVGIEAVMRVSSVISRSAFRGTFRSHRISTVFPFRSASPRSSTDFLACKLVHAFLGVSAWVPQNA